MFTLIVTVTLTFDLLIPFSIGVIYWPRLMHLWSIKPIGQSVDELLIGDDFYTYCDSDLRPSDPNFNRGHLLTKANAHVKYQANRSIRSQVIDRKRTGLPTDTQTDRQTRRPTDRHPAKQYTPSSSKGGNPFTSYWSKTNWSTDRQTDLHPAKQYTPSSSKGGNKYNNLLCI